MLMKLVMPQVNRMMQGASIVTWHRGVGDRVGYGDDLLDVQVVLEIPRYTNPLGEKIRALAQIGSRGGHAPVAARGSCAASFLVRITSSDTGILQRICAREGEQRTVGDLLAVLAPDDDAPAGEEDSAMRQASAFRVVANIL